MSAEGWTLEHDDQHTSGELAKAAACYAATGAVPEGNLPPAAQDMMTRTWPWAREWWKPRGGRADLVRAAALLVAEIERLDRKPAREATDAG
ncbi:hypothetical protein [Pseudoroseomonas cervicalis]|uniref:hypothetical protein n=1 Tax=Teichococcus cervicalis TaxID=204525 RepID=UPI0022F18DF3|nr:hypothetical protein [Pseudoroseomonas cervicalis]WBV42759.1 hypothetical protein PFY06_16165 [Pseudoroseomonas cervicalis]